jgi:hypothetical protein
MPYAHVFSGLEVHQEKQPNSYPHPELVHLSHASCQCYNAPALCQEQRKGIDARGPTRSNAQSFLVLLINHHAFREETLAIRHAFEDDLSPDADSTFLSFLFQNL